MKTMVFFIWVFGVLTCLPLATSLTHNGKHNIEAFKIKSFFYFAIVFLSLFVGAVMSS